VIRNREALLQKYSLTPENTVRLRVHFETEDFCRYKLVSAKHSGQGMVDDNVVPADALITTEPNLALLLPVADCIGAVIYDETKSVLALAHLGRHSLEQYGGKKIIEHLVENFSVNIEDLHIWMTPAAGKEVYPIWKLDNKGMKEAAHEQFASAGIKQTQITDDATETTTSSDYFSYSDYLKGNRASDGDHAILAVMH
jgi:copper oxidase (laccase) domain-containing protein